MRRTLVILAATGAGLGLLLSFKTTAVHAPTSGPPSASAPPVSEPRRSSTTSTRSVSGPAVNTLWGPVQVRVTFSGSRISDVHALQLPGDFARSQEINSYAAPVLRKEVLAVQGWQIDVVSGATYTSDGYRQSLQAVLDGGGG
jgi:uncharacterized protein with FMN-binding domain